MTPCFADTFYFIALLNSEDHAHAKASAIAKIRRPIITMTWILAELGDGLANTPARKHFAEFTKRLRANPSVTILPASQNDFDSALELYENRPDKAWSLTDCISFTVMQDRRLTEALTGDHHFEQAGFTAILK